MSRISKLMRYYESHSMGWSELQIRLVSGLTPEEVPELIELAPPEALQRLKEDALCGKRFPIFQVGSYISKDGGKSFREQREREEEAFNQGLAVLRGAFE